MSYVSLINVLIAYVSGGKESETVREATPDDIKRYFGWKN